MIQVTSVEPGADYRLILTFATGERRCFDMRPYLEYPVFLRLQNPAFFAFARVDYGTVTWPGEIDIAPETLYERSTPADMAGVGCGEERTASYQGAPQRWGGKDGMTKGVLGEPAEH